MTVFGLILMILAGLVLFLLELLVIPGVGVAGIGALVLMALAVFLAFSHFGTVAGFVVLLGVVVSMGLSLLLTFRSGTWRKASLSTEMKSKVKEGGSLGIQPGDEGTTITRLAPVGTVQIGEHRLEGRSEGPFIDHQIAIIVISVESTYVVVKPK
jgi:membrane-bound ClpP family serine protease